MQLFELLQLSPGFAIFSAILFGLLVGSFLNVVIYRLPKMMEAEWRSECESLFNPDDVDPNKAHTLTLAKPASHCPKCNHKITAIENIPLLSYLFQGGKCTQCKTRISPRYPLIELCTGLAAGYVMYHFGFGIAAGLALILSFALIALSAIDFDTQLLPDDITFPLLWLGLIANLFGVFAPLRDAVIGAIVGYLILWSIYWLFKLVTGKEGMGYGDFKLLAALGAWFGWQALPVIVITSSLVGSVIGVAMLVFTDHEKSKPIPFGPYLAIAGWLTLIGATDGLQKMIFPTIGL